MHHRIGSAAAAIAVLLAAGTLWAHHSFTVVFDASKQFTLTGTLTKIDWRNPHIEIFVEAKGDGGQVEAWRIEGFSPSFFRNHNVGKSDFEKGIGQTVTVEGVRAKDGSLYGLLRQITFPDGKSVKLPELQSPACR
jgi:hypothetical protein